MASSKISDLTGASALDGTEAFPIVQGGANRKATGTQIKTLANTLDVPNVVSASATLTSAAYGVIQYVDTAGVVLTFPAAPATTQVIKVYNGSGGSISVNGVTVGSGKDITFISVASAWKRFQPAVDLSGGGISAPRVATRYYPALPGARYATGTGLTANTVYFQPFVLAADITIDRLAAEIQAAGAASSTGAMAIYAGNPATGKPTGNPVVSGSGTFATDSTGAKTVTPASNVTLTAGTLYFFAIISSSTPAFYCDETSNSVFLMGNSSASVGRFGNCWRPSTGVDTVGTWRDMTSVSVFEAGNTFIGGFRVA